MANRRFIDFPIASTSGDTDIILIWQDGANKQTTKATFLSGLPENLEDLNDVAISGLTNGQILRYDSVTGKWENTDQGNLDLNDLNDVSIVSPSNGQVLVYNSSTSQWENSSGGYVPYVGAVTTVDLGAQGLRAGYVRFDTTVAGVPNEQGLMFWDADDETVDIILNGYTMKIGEDLFYPVKNQTGSTIAKGVAVRFNGTVGASGRLLIAPFIADGSVPSSRFMGVTAEEILNGEDGKVLYFGRVRGINTNAFNEGDILYASTTTAGGYQTAIPVAPNNIVQVAAVVTKSATVGTIFVRPTLGSNINKDEGVKIVSVADKNLLQYQSGTSLWENKSLAQVLGGTSAQFVKGDGSLDSTSYGTGTVTSVGLSSATSGVTIGSSPVTTSGTITLAIATASGSQNGLLSSTDWTTFNNKQNALTNPVTGTGASGQVAYFNGTTSITSESALLWDSTNDRLGIGVSPAQKLDVNGIAQFRDDIRFSTTNSSIGYTDAIRFVELGVSTRLTLSSGNLGLGVTPSAWNSAYKAMQFGTTGAIFGESGDAANYFTTNTFVDSVGFKYITSDWALGYFQENGVHSWRNAPSGTAGNAISFTQAMTLFSTGNLLVGTPSPISDNGARLQVSGTGRFTGTIFANTQLNNTVISPTDATNITNGFNLLGSQSYWGIRTTTAGNFALDVYGAGSTRNALTILQASGSVGIGTTSPSSGLELGSGLDLKMPSNGNIIFGNSNVLIYKTSGQDGLSFNTGGSERMRITSSGNVGIGTASPYANLDLGASGANNIILRNTTNAYNLGYIGNSSGRIDIGFSNSNGSLVPLPYLSVNSSGNVGIGTPSPTYRLQIADNSNNLLQLNGNNTTGLIDTGFTITADDSKNIYLTQREYAYLGFGTNNATYVSISSNGKVGIGTTPILTSSALLELDSTTGSLLLPRMTTTQRNALTAVNGMLIYNSTDNKFQGYENGAWTDFI